MDIAKKAKSFGSGVMMLALFAVLALLAFGFIYGMLWVSAKLLPVTLVLSGLGFVVLVPMLLASLVSRRSRRFCGNGVMVVSYIWGAALWMYATLVLFELWGSLGLLLGFVLLGFGSVPLACIAALLHGEWALLGEMVFGFVIIAATRFLGIWIASKGTSQWDQYEVAD